LSLTPFTVSAFSFYQACFILSSTFSNTFQWFLKANFLMFYFVASFSQRRLIIIPDFLLAVKYFFKYLSFFRCICFAFHLPEQWCLHILPRFLRFVKYFISYNSTLFLFVRKRVLLYLEALSFPHALEFFVFCCFSACLPLDLQ